jgi:hypothetical protein
LPDDVFADHLARGDFHRWVERVFGDVEPGDAFRRTEGAEAAKAREAMMRAIVDRYGEAGT